MSRLPDAFHEDRALRDAARAVLLTDVEHARTTLSGKGIAQRVTGRIGDGALDVIEVAKVNTVGRPGLLAGLIAVIALWFAREPILEILGLTTSASETDGESGNADNASVSESDQEPEPAYEDLDDGPGLSDTFEPEADQPEIETSEPALSPQADDKEPLSTGEMA